MFSNFEYCNMKKGSCCEYGGGMAKFEELESVVFFRVKKKIITDIDWFNLQRFLHRQ